MVALLNALRYLKWICRNTPDFNLFECNNFPCINVITCKKLVFSPKWSVRQPGGVVGRYKYDEIGKKKKKSYTSWGGSNYLESVLTSCYNSTNASFRGCFHDMLGLVTSYPNQEHLTLWFITSDVKSIKTSTLCSLAAILSIGH